ncbi:MAG TPA: hypothetical protein VL754_14390 [Verrucomicrobiae bacterium]|nr:hypothetical protein [Verrucomicrobiae bacterium]
MYATGTWKLQCRECGKVFFVSLAASDDIARAVKEYPCPQCGTTPWERKIKLGVHWHEIIDFILQD